MAKIKFIVSDNSTFEVDAPIGQSIMNITKAHPFALEAACGGSMVCATCQVTIGKQWHALIPVPSAQEEEVLDIAFGVTPESRLGCQVLMTEELDGMEVFIPDPLSENLEA